MEGAARCKSSKTDPGTMILLLLNLCNGIYGISGVTGYSGHCDVLVKKCFAIVASSFSLLGEANHWVLFSRDSQISLASIGTNRRCQYHHHLRSDSQRVRSPLPTYFFMASITWVRVSVKMEKGTLHFLFTTVKSLEVQVFVFRKEIEKFNFS